MRETFTIGNRVQVGASGHHGHFATLRFIGDLEGQAGITVLNLIPGYAKSV